jgi:hypothetical protein
VLVLLWMRRPRQASRFLLAETLLALLAVCHSHRARRHRPLPDGLRGDGLYLGLPAGDGLSDGRAAPHGARPRTATPCPNHVTLRIFSRCGLSMPLGN